MFLISPIKNFFHSFMSILYKSVVLVRVGSHGERLYVHGKSILSKNTFLGNNVNLNGMNVLGSGCLYIGDNFHSGEDCLIITSNHNYDNGSKIPYDEGAVEKTVRIEDNVWIGSRVIILGGVNIGEGAIIQAGAVVVSNIPACGIAGGNPARVFKYRNIDHYNELKNSKSFF